MARDTVAPDVGQLVKQDLPNGDFPGRRGQRFRVYLSPEVHQEILRHGGTDTGVEVCGVLVGAWQRDDDGPFVVISASIRGDAAANKFAEVTFTHETWAKINQKMDAEFTDRLIVGWYHTHPDFGIFLSDRDRFIHEHFFSGAGQVAYVVDPVRKSEGFFTWSDGKPAPCAHYWVGTQVCVALPKEPDTQTKASGQAGREGTPRQSASGVNHPRDYTWLSSSLLGLCLFMLGYLLASRISDMDRLRMQQGVAAYYGITKVLKPGLGVNLDQAVAALTQISDATRRLAAEQSGPTTRPATEFAAAYTELAAHLSDCQNFLNRIRDVYALTPDEEAFMEKAVLQVTAAAGGERISLPGTRPAVSGTDSGQPMAGWALPPAVPLTGRTIQPSPPATRPVK